MICESRRPRLSSRPSAQFEACCRRERLYRRARHQSSSSSTFDRRARAQRAPLISSAPYRRSATSRWRFNRTEVGAEPIVVRDDCQSSFFVLTVTSRLSPMTHPPPQKALTGGYPVCALTSTQSRRNSSRGLIASAVLALTLSAQTGAFAQTNTPPANTQVIAPEAGRDPGR